MNSKFRFINTAKILILIVFFTFYNTTGGLFASSLKNHSIASSKFYISEENKNKLESAKDNFDIEIYREDLRRANHKVEFLIQDIFDRYYKDVDIDLLISSMYKGIYKALDPHSTILIEQEKEEINSHLSGKFGGVGIVIEEFNDYIRITDVLEDTPAKKSGLKKGDIIKEVNFESIYKKRLNEVVKIIKGKVGYPVVFKIDRVGEKEFEVRILRDEIKVKSVNHFKKDSVDVIKIYTFGEDTYNEVEKIIKNNNFKNGLILDLRDNPGGYLMPALRVADLFLPRDKEILHIMHRGEKTDTYKTKNSAYKMPLVVLINKSSASASEILAGVLKEYKRATIVGEKSFGKGTVQNLLELSDGSMIKLTVGEYILVNNKSVDKVGIEPDLKVSVQDFSKYEKDFYPMNSLGKSALGSKDIDTFGLQQRLNFFGYSLKVDGVFDIKTQEALKDFQSKNNLEATGVLNLKDKIEIQKLFFARLISDRDLVLELAINTIKK